MLKKATGQTLIGCMREAKDLVDSSTPDTFRLAQTSYIYSDDGTQLAALAESEDATYLSYEDIPADVVNAFVSVEDRTFWNNSGVDYKGILRVCVNYVKTKGQVAEGASTITQQLLKNNVFTNWTNESTQVERFTRKLQEQFLAVEIEKKIGDKNVILENYLNTINLGAGAYGVQAAARQYFNKDVWDLNLSECATLAGITQAPTKYNPIENPKENAKRRKEVLDHMLDQGYITQEQYDDAINDDVYTRIQEAQASNTQSSSKTYSYFEDELTKQVINDLMNIKGYTKTQAQNLLYSGG